MDVQEQSWAIFISSSTTTLITLVIITTLTFFSPSHHSSHNHHSHHSPHDHHLLTILLCFSPCGTLMSRAGHLPREKPGVTLSVDDHKHDLIVEIDHKHHSSNHNVYDKHARAIYFCITLCTQSLPLCISKIHRSTSSKKKRIFNDLLQNEK